MKKIYAFRHTEKDGKRGTVGPRGIELARFQTQTLDLGSVGPTIQGRFTEGDIGPRRKFTRLFYGPQDPNIETALVVSASLGYTIRIMPTVFELGDETIMAGIVTEPFTEALKRGTPIFDAIMQVHDHDDAERWGEFFRMAVIDMFNAMGDGEIAVCCLYGIPLVLAALACDAKDSGIEGWNQLREMEALIFTADGENIPRVAGKICAPARAKPEVIRLGIPTFPAADHGASTP